MDGSNFEEDDGRSRQDEYMREEDFWTAGESRELSRPELKSEGAKGHDGFKIIPQKGPEGGGPNLGFARWGALSFCFRMIRNPEIWGACRPHDVQSPFCGRADCLFECPGSGRFAYALLEGPGSPRA